MVQSFNFAAMRSLGKVFYNRSLVIPHLMLQDVRSIDFARLRSMGFDAVLFDKDNTLTEPYADHVYAPFSEALEHARRVFGPKGIAVLSNSAGSSDDHDFVEATRLERELCIPVIKHGTKKPEGIEAVIKHFNDTEPSRIIMVGDRFLTDILFGNLYGMMTIYTSPITSVGDNGAVKLIRDKEKSFVMYNKQHYNAPVHPLFNEESYLSKSSS
ncbi:hypothetical protein SAMD00019534_075540 [Acytostelium subglobosum LB1]|uniref:hypothetical protein n=1 Tax=Acytostelium subglobosum LB1 TaxID=1410327 RepID=UPI000644DC8A|nr:hypothetical protein SAMD00019534_075540 [Acytostelium subglobosum LB1]GAM24379.1 hypothetical protein SAMD00019534_075540 [Acytostelium subglobosum LB1]|eukprot:XP_012752705.1 hypothetical protein SAMD00019534_075540 [Acytostelium subglobosum LB1]